MDKMDQVDDLFMEEYHGFYKWFGLAYIKKYDSVKYTTITEKIRQELLEKTEEKKEDIQRKEERARIEQSWKEAQEKEEVQREQNRLQQKENPDWPLTWKDIREIKGFDSNDYKRALEELNVEILKRIARKSYSHKF